jgi:hypothetical protein
MVPKKMDLHMVKYVIGNRKADVERDRDLIKGRPWDHSDVFYAVRTSLNRLGWDTSVYNDSEAGGSDRRKSLYDKIQDVCEKTYGVKRHQIGIFPDERAIMAFKGGMYAVGFEELSELMHNGTDVIVVEKAGTVMKMVPFTSKSGIAFIQSQGFVSEYGIALAGLCNGQGKIARVYASDDNGRYYVPQYVGHLGVLTDCDHSGVMIGAKIPGAYRLGIDVTSIDEINNANPGLARKLRLEDLVEGTKPNTHWKSLLNLAKGTGKLVKELSEDDRIYYMNYLRRKIRIMEDGKVKVVYDDDEEWQYFISYLARNRIELNTILAAVEPQVFWNWLKWKLETIWPERNYNRARLLEDALLTPTMKKFDRWLEELSEEINKEAIDQKRKELEKVKGFYEDVEAEEEKIKDDIIENTMLHDKRIQKIDLALKAIMRDGLGRSESGREQS